MALGNRIVRFHIFSTTDIFIDYLSEAWTIGIFICREVTGHLLSRGYLLLAGSEYSFWMFILLVSEHLGIWKSLNILLFCNEEAKHPGDSRGL